MTEPQCSPDSERPDIVERLRVWPAGYGEDTLASHVVGRIMKDAADVIDLLRNDLDQFMAISHEMTEENKSLRAAAQRLPSREEIYRAIESNVRSEPDKHFIDRRWMVGIYDAVDAILALSSTQRGDK